MPCIPILIIGLFVPKSSCAGLARSVLSCQACLQVADSLKLELKAPFHSSDDLVGEVRPRRNTRHPRSETEIFKAMDRICLQVSSRKPSLLITLQ
eukprot:jgi/Botrbrau1/20012/Bobra.200_1s0018.1